MIEITNLEFSYNPEIPVLKDVNMHIRKGEKVGIIGANGVGKSTLLRLLVGIEQGYQGRVLVHGLEVTKKNIKKVRQNIGYVFQDSDSQLFMPTVYEDVAFGPQNQGKTEDEVDAVVREALQKVQIADLANRSIYSLSGGQKKLAALATVLAMEPEILFLDEPSVALDPKNRRILINILRDMNETMLIATHDLDFVLDVCDKVVLLSEHCIASQGDTSVILRDQTLLEANGLELPLCFSRRE